MYKMKCAWTVFVMVLLVWWEPSEGGIENSEIVYPEKIHNTRTKRDLDSTLNERHNDMVTLQIKSKQEGDLVVDLKKDIPVQDKVVVRTYSKDGTPQHDLLDHPNCLYSGSIRGRRDSGVYVRMCDEGISGSLDTGTSSYQLDPNHGNENGAHTFTSVEDEIKELAKQLKKAKDNLNDLLVSEEEEEAKTKQIYTKLGEEVRNSVKPMGLIDVEAKYLPYLTVNHTRYMELFVSVDHHISQRFHHNITKIFQDVMTVIGHVDKSYSAIGIRLALVAMEVQNNGPTFPRNPTNGFEDLRNFRTHFMKIRKEEKLKDIRIDNGMLASGHGWDGIAGVAYVGAMCTSASVSVNGWFNNLRTRTGVLGHELGHNMNFHHDSDQCTCLENRGCWMGGKRNGPSASGTPGFSDCNLKRLALKDFSCLNDLPMNPLTSSCGNGIREAGEECDCGSVENCARNDPCCQPRECKLKSEAQCSFINEPACCDSTCQFKQQGSMCREAATNCDVPEYCTGASATCPSDRLIADGTACGEHKTLILGTSRSKQTRRELWCPANQDVSTFPTTMLTPRLHYVVPMCLSPQVRSCNASEVEGTNVVYLKDHGTPCKGEYAKFLHSYDGTLRHHCTGLKVCPSGKDKHLVISTRCTDEESTFKRTDEGALRHVTTGLCVHSSARYGPLQGQKAYLKNKCSERPAKLTFLSTDCKLPLGLKDGSIPDSALSSGPTTNSARDIRTGRGWCFLTAGGSSWVQVDMGKVVEVSAIDVGAGYWFYVTGLHLMYSDNGISWKYYKETDTAGNSKGLESVCFAGSCALTADDQCRDLWGADATSASQQCYGLNVKTEDGYGTCSPSQITPCEESNMKCGQLQCISPEPSPLNVNYGRNYTTLTVDGHNCSVAKIINADDEIGEGMVEDGTVCGNGKICVGQQCKHATPTCGRVNGKMCGGRGWCMDNGRCHCYSGYNPDDDCASEVRAVDGGWSSWSLWSRCDACAASATGSATRRRHRFCNNPTAKYGGKGCEGERVQEEDCREKGKMKNYECYRWTGEDLKMVMNKGYEFKKKYCQARAGFVFSKGDESKAPGCGSCYCCKPIAELDISSDLYGESSGCCTSTTPCEEGEGNCETDQQCAGTLVCGKDNCSNNSTNVNCCKKALRCNGINNGCCTETNPCEEGDGDCDFDSQCSGDLVCGIDNCNLEGLSRFNSRHDCCKKKVASFY